MPEVTLDDARAAKEKLKTLLAGKSAVNGIGITQIDGDYALSVNLLRELAEGEFVPDRIDGVAVHTAVVGEARKLL